MKGWQRSTNFHNISQSQQYLPKEIAINFKNVGKYCNASLRWGWQGANRIIYFRPDIKKKDDLYYQSKRSETWGLHIQGEWRRSNPIPQIISFQRIYTRDFSYVYVSNALRNQLICNSARFECQIWFSTSNSVVAHKVALAGHHPASMGFGFSGTTSISSLSLNKPNYNFWRVNHTLSILHLHIKHTKHRSANIPQQYKHVQTPLRSPPTHHSSIQ